MALKVKHTEMNGDTSRWLTRDEAKIGAKKERRAFDMQSVLESMDDVDVYSETDGDKDFG